MFLVTVIKHTTVCVVNCGRLCSFLQLHTLQKLFISDMQPLVLGLCSKSVTITYRNGRVGDLKQDFCPDWEEALLLSLAGSWGSFV